MKVFQCVLSCLLLAGCSVKYKNFNKRGFFKVRKVIRSTSWISSDSAKVKGTVLSSTYGKPLQDALIYTEKPKRAFAFTNECGQFEFMVKAGTYKFVVMRTGNAQEYSREIKLEPRSYIFVSVELGTSIIY